ncbi:ADP-glyceromanno-heptose 6-epimerase [candidate division WOR-1 bacterium RIFOXYA12_FULL_52_29]|uniref:ADP-L-glycero-D-manno-heptose-6-epimerase n=1 Tax=candidate division WOR-1 bacterium RIFOXYC12_FULL_54_18 TaxID=1802584 RepID=A0A1F4T4F7_UNCSA|nr:MAG: ADP-glyceromanno-heptose 6-epimerase [candidate division WOR-1 bacterium RIFOXYA2_FULL_51_19]OGC17029.1 MAG: ADP-glyceromanno-heptose 6-epimerase [candidate division WOR-1 bacterium RIFOXYA12_FULL_52_29]OGC25890.1 MAG: ADP-glyceromanno-heptose 6-epimerase [candidate division WOR-1 bacterium RIFOXYB2_FULL_45_9]OGC27446.1 MAG: ADP-glyceromanno-heptose 6-epimerase [candidate division WOR-1 bacterium RIFOXYC12_FULL_54_18]OGC29341.1 MAG: ADP-glyceromanno-heptose 6-epimerase [candidate divisi
MKFIVTGGAGFIGSAMVWKLNQAGESDILVADHLGSSEKWQNLNGKVFADYLEKDIFLEELLAGKFGSVFKAVFHIGACSSTTEADATYMMENNYHYSKRLAQWALAKNIPFIYASSAATYGDGSLGYSDEDAVSLKLQPLNVYGYSKLLFDQWLIRNNLVHKVVGLKYFNVFGPNEYHKGEMRSVVLKGYEQIKKDGKIKLFRSYRNEFADGEQKRDFIYVKDVVNLMYQLYLNNKVRGVFNLGSGAARSWNDLAGAIFNALGTKPHVEYIEMPDILKEKYQYFTEAKMDKLATAGINFTATPLEEAVADYVRAYLEPGMRYL